MRSRKKKKITEMSLEELETLKKHNSYYVEHYKSLIPNNIEQLQKEYEEKSKRNFNEERGKLRQDPKNQIKSGFLNFGTTKWTEDCEKKCQQIDAEQKAVSDFGYLISQHIINRTTHQEYLEKLTKVTSQIDKLLKQQEALKKKRLKQEELKLRAKRNEDEVRAMASSIKRSISEIVHSCPYCGNDLGQIPHADHIYPVSKGGLSVSKNMVMVCSKCNLKKKDLTLREFITKFSMNRDEIENRLEELGKSF
jgi:5-methylcytosine-specific restriction endonuclease McrA